VSVVRRLTEHIVVPFAGEGSGLGELTWGQLEILPIMERDGSAFSIGGWMPLPPGRTVAEVADDLRFVMSRHAALRTRLRIGGDGHPRQEVTASGTAVLEVVDAGDADPLETAMAVHRRLEGKAFDWDTEWPIRWLVIVSRGVPTHLVSLISHLAADGAGVMRIFDEIARRDGDAGPEPAPVIALQPLDLARRQAAPAALRQNEAALRYWAGLLRTIPALRPDLPPDEQSPRYCQAFYDSPASYLALQVVAARTGAGTATVLLAAYAVVLARLTGRSPAVVQTVVNNRFRRGLGDMVASLCNFGLCVIDVADVPFDEAVARAWRSSVRAYKYAYCNPVERTDLIERVRRERGAEIDLTCFINDRRMLLGDEPDDAQLERALPEAAQIRAALPESELSWGYQTDDERERCYLHINNVPDGLQFELLGDTRYLTRSQLIGLLHGLGQVLTEAALDPATRTGVLAGASAR
jgi:hypothetical protein